MHDHTGKRFDHWQLRPRRRRAIDLKITATAIEKSRKPFLATRAARLRIWDNLENYKEVAEALEETNEAVISHRLNDILRVLTSISVVILPLTFLTGLFGMNVNFPGFGSAVAFWSILGFFLVVIVGMLGFFRFKRWL